MDRGAWRATDSGVAESDTTDTHIFPSTGYATLYSTESTYRFKVDFSVGVAIYMLS